MKAHYASNSHTPATTVKHMKLCANNTETLWSQFSFLYPSLKRLLFFFFSFLPLFSLSARQNRVRTEESCRERTDLPGWPSVHTERTQNWKSKKEWGSYWPGPPGQRKRLGLYREGDMKTGHKAETLKLSWCKCHPKNVDYLLTLETLL